MCGIKSFQVFTVLIASTLVEAWWTAKWLCSNWDGTMGEVER